MIEPTGLKAEPARHAVCFYGSDEDWASVVAPRLARTAARGGTILVVAFPARLEPVRAAFETAGIDLAALRRAGRFQMFDAREMLAEFIVDDQPDANAFHATVGAAVRDAATSDGELLVYGEMVAALWSDGNVTGALELETLWNNLAHDVEFSLLCAYPRSGVDEASDAFLEICALHSDVEDTGEGVVHASRTFAASLHTVRHVRAFTAETLRRWGFERLTDDVVAVVSEMASNAIVHALADFVVTLSAGGGFLRVGVQDFDPRMPALRDRPQDLRDNGRGLLLVNAIAPVWGTDRTDGHKTVWARFPIHDES